MARVTGVLLAAGSGSRMGVPKAGLMVAGERLVDRAARTLAAGCDRVVVVGRAGLRVPGAQVLVNHNPERGMRSSLALGIIAADASDAIAVLLVDTPGVTAAAVRAVVAAWRPGRIAVARYGEQRGHPTVMSPGLWHAALELAGPDEGARALLAARPHLVDVLDVPGSAEDLDQAADVQAWEAGSAVTIRTAVAGDLAELRGVYGRAAAVSDPDLELPTLDVQPGRTRVAVDAAGTLTGFLTMRFLGECLEVDDLFVEPSRMGRGIGRGLVADAAELASARGMARLAVIANEAAVGFYERAGFHRDETVRTRFGTGVRMYREIE